MKSRIGVLFYPLLLAFEACFALGAGAGTVADFSFGMISGIERGRIDEEVYENGKCISRLVWPREAVPFVGFAAGVRVGNFALSARVADSIPVKGGSIEDFDYLLPDSDVPSLYSRHDSYLDKDFRVRAKLGYAIGMGRRFWVTPAIGISYVDRKWTARDGYLQYPEISGVPWTGDEDRRSVKGAVLSYEQSAMNCMVGLQPTVELNESLKTGFSLFWYPFVRGDSLDSHFLRALEFYDALREGNGYGLGGWILVKPFGPRGNAGLRLSCDYEYLTARGDTYSNVIGLSDDTFALTEGYSARNAGYSWTFSFAVVFGENRAGFGL